MATGLSGTIGQRVHTIRDFSLILTHNFSIQALGCWDKAVACFDVRFFFFFFFFRMLIIDFPRPSSVRRSFELFQRQRWGNFRGTGKTGIKQPDFSRSMHAYFTVFAPFIWRTAYLASSVLFKMISVRSEKPICFLSSHWAHGTLLAAGRSRSGAGLIERLTKPFPPS